MKLGISYNLFDGEELLESSIENIRKYTHHINVVYQKVSNVGNKTTSDLDELLSDLMRRQLIHSITEYTPNVSQTTHFNELAKRNIGLECSKLNGCDYHMSMDTDEFYDSTQFEKIQKFMNKHPEYDSAVCQMQTYYKEPCYVIDPPEDYYVSLMFKINPESKYDFYNFPVLVDPTRRMKVNNCAIFGRDVIEMHHFSYIRKNIRIKLENSSAVGNFKHKIDNLVKSFDNWKFGDIISVAGVEERLYNCKKVESKFNI